MKKLFPIFLLAIFAFVACDDDDSDRISVNDDLKAFIEQKYPAASILYAEYDDNGLVEVNTYTFKTVFLRNIWIFFMIYFT